jgi:hypothetical protein
MDKLKKKKSTCNIHDGLPLGFKVDIAKIENLERDCKLHGRASVVFPFNFGSFFFFFFLIFYLIKYLGFYVMRNHTSKFES